MNEIKAHWRKWIYTVSIGIILIVVYKTLDSFASIAGVVKRFFDILGPFLAGIFIAYLLYMPCKKMESSYKKSKWKFVKKRARGLSVLTTYVITLLIIIILFNVIMPVVLKSIEDFINSIQSYYEIAMQNYSILPEDSLLKVDAVSELIDSVKNINIKQYFNLDNILSYVLNVIGAMTSVLDVFVAVVVSIYILLERTQVVAFLRRFASAMFKENTYRNLDRYFTDSNEIFFKFVASQLLDAVIVGVLVTIAMLIMKVKYAPLLGFIIGLFNIIPYFGAIIAIAIVGLITFITGGLSQTIIMLIVIIVLQQIDANVINPRIVGKSLKISPLLVIFAVTVGGAYFGIIGMFLAVPVIAILRIIVEEFIDYKLKING